MKKAAQAKVAKTRRIEPIIQSLFTAGATPAIAVEI